MTLGREQELVAQPRKLLDGAWSSTTELVGSVVECSVVKVESGGLLDTNCQVLSMSEEACGGIRRRRGRKKRALGKVEHSDEVVEPAGSNPQASRCSKRRKKQQSTCLVTSVPDFDGYQWRKYGQKQIEGAMYQRSYYRCTRSAEQCCPAKRTVQRNDDDGNNTPSPKYTVVYMAEHTCSANNDSMEAPVILETTPIPATKKKRRPCDADGTKTVVAGGPFLPETDQARHDAAAVADSSSSPITSTGTESLATSDVTWSGSASNKEHVLDDFFDDSGVLFTVDDRWGVQDMDDFTGPILSPVHIAAGGWAMDHQYLMLHVVNDPISHFSAGFSNF